MSRITNDNPPKRGEQLTSTELNQVFTEVNDAFPLDGDNVRNEGIEQPSFNLSGTSGKSGIILIAADDDDDSGSTTVNANTAEEPPFNAATTVHSWAITQTFNEDKIIRVYWQFVNEMNDPGNYNDPIDENTNSPAFVVWLEWQLSFGGSWEPVPNQSDFEDLLKTQPLSIDRHGAKTEDTYASTLINYVYIHEHSSTTEYDTPPERTAYGCWWYKADQNYTIYGLRLRSRGLVINYYEDDPDTGDATNAWLLVQSASVDDYNMVVKNSNIAYMIMEEK